MLSALAFGVLLLTQTTSALTWKTKTTDNITFQYPSNWKLKHEPKYSGFEATLSKGAAVIKLEYDKDGSFSGDPDSVLSFIENFAEERMGGNGGSIQESGTDKYFINNASAPYVIATGSKQLLFTNLNWVDMAIGINANGTTVLGQYISDQDNFEKNQPTALKIFESVKANPRPAETLGQ